MYLNNLICQINLDIWIDWMGVCVCVMALETETFLQKFFALTQTLFWNLKGANHKLTLFMESGRGRP